MLYKINKHNKYFHYAVLENIFCIFKIHTPLHYSVYCLKPTSHFRTHLPGISANLLKLGKEAIQKFDTNINSKQTVYKKVFQ